MSLTDLFLRDAQHSQAELDHSNTEYAAMEALATEIATLHQTLASKEAQYRQLERNHYYTAPQAIECALRAPKPNSKLPIAIPTTTLTNSSNFPKKVTI